MTRGSLGKEDAQDRRVASDVVFLDRDGVVNFDSPDFVRCVEDWRPIPGSLETIAALSRAGRRVMVVTNQSGVARGLMSRDAVDAIHTVMERAVEKMGGRIDGVFVCPHGPDGQCRCRKPRAGLLRQASEMIGRSIEGAPLVGDRETDLVAASRADCRPILIQSGDKREAGFESEWPDVPRFESLAAALPMLLEWTVATDEVE